MASHDGLLLPSIVYDPDYKIIYGIYFPRNLKLKIPNIPDFQPDVFAVPSPECGLWLLKHFGCSMNIFNETVKNLEQGVKNVSPQLFT